MQRLRPSRLLVLAVATLALTVPAVTFVLPGLHVPGVPFANDLQPVLPGFTSAFTGAVDLGAMANTPIQVGVALTPQDSALSAQMIQDIYTPGSPEYGHYLTAAQYETLFSPPANELAQVERYYAGYGLTATPSADRLIVSLSGGSDAIGQAFGTSFDNYRLSDGSLVYGPATGVTVPAGLGIDAVTSFSNLVGPEPTYTGSPVLPASTGGNATPAACDPVSGDSPAVLEGQYGETSILSTDNGAGMKVGIVDAYDSDFTQADASSDLTSFASGCGLATPHINFLYPERTTANLNSTPSTGWGGETELDIETVDSMAPGATIDLTFASDSSLAVYESVDYLVANNVTNTISMSWGEPDEGTDHEPPQNPCLAYYSCNASWDGSYDFLHPVFAEAVAEGISPFSAAGDCGAYDGTSILTTDYPGSDPYVTDVGGTVLNSTGTTYGGESGWSGDGKDCTVNEGGGGGGYAPFPRPFWQSGEGLSTTNDLRGAPDVSASAADGTSEATPIWAGLTAVADEADGGTGLGLLGPSLYSILRNPTEYAADFHDIVVGNNGYPAGRGWDPVTGIGSPDISNLIPDLFRYQPPAGQAMTVTLTASPGTTAAETFAATVTGGTGPYKYDFVPGLDLGQWAGKNATLGYTYAADGSYFATVEVWDSSGNWSESSPVLVQVGGTALTVSLSASTTSTTVGTPVTFTTTTTGGTAPYTYDYLWGDGTYGYNATPSDSHTYEAPGTYCPTVEVQDSASPANGGLGSASCITVAQGAPGLAISATATPTTGTAPLAVTFGSIPTGGSGTYTAFAWHFGDGGTSALQSPTYTYTTAGTFTAWVNVTDSSGATAQSNLLTVTVSSGTTTLTMGASATPTTGGAPLAVDFTGTPAGGTGTYTTYLWVFGDGTDGHTQSPTHTYTAAGTYYAWANVTDSGGVTAMSNVLTITVQKGTALLTVSASGTPTSGSAPLDVAFTATATGGSGTYTSYAWTFGDGDTGSGASVTHTYTGVGTFSAQVTVTDSAGDSVTSGTIAITVSSGTTSLSVLATDSSGGGTAPVDEQFTAIPSGGTGTYTAFSWHFGDGTTGTGEDAVHTYDLTGTYLAWVNVTDSSGSMAESDELTIAVTGGLALALHGPPSEPAGTNLSFFATASGGAGSYTYAWDFGDGSAVRETGSSNLTTHVYASANTYSVKVTVTDASGASVTAVVSVVVTAPTSTTTSTPGGLSTLDLLLLGIVAAVAIGAVAAVLLLRKRRSSPPEQPAMYYPPPTPTSWAGPPPSG